MTLLKTLLVLILAWIGSVWPSSWTVLLLLVGVSLAFLTMAFDRMRARTAND